MLKLLTLTLLLFPAAAFADSIQYTFSTVSGVNGSFAFEASTPFTVTTGLFQGYYFPDPTPFIQAISEQSLTLGTYGNYSFSGNANILWRDFQAPFDAALDLGQQDYWFFRSFVMSPMVQGRSLMFLGLYDYKSPRSEMGPFLAPPPNPGCPPPIPSTCIDFQYLAQFSDGTSESGSLATLAMVSQQVVTPAPEPSSLMLLSVGVFGVILYRRGTSSRRNLRQPER